MRALSQIRYIFPQVLERIRSASRPILPTRLFHATTCRHQFTPPVADHERPVKVRFNTLDNQTYDSGIVSTLRPERLTGADVLHIPVPAHRIKVAFNPPIVDKSNPAVSYTPSPSVIFNSTPSRRSHTVILRASLENHTAEFPPGWGCLYWWTPPPGGSTAATDGEVRYRPIASVASLARAWSDKAIRDAFERSPDHRLSDGTPWSASLFAHVMRRMAYAEDLVSRRNMASTLNEYFAEKYMERRRVQAMTDPSLAFLGRHFPTVDHNTILPKPDQFSIPDDPEEAIRAWETDRAPLRVYSDGALYGKVWVGAAAVLERLDDHNKFSLTQTRRVHLGRIPPWPQNVADGEIVGLGVALALAAEEPTVGRLTVFSDSQLALEAVRSSAARPRQWRLADYVLARYDLLVRRHPKAEVMFRWIPSHIGVDGNDMADALAHEASRPPRRESIR